MIIYCVIWIISITNGFFRNRNYKQECSCKSVTIYGQNLIEIYNFEQKQIAKYLCQRLQLLSTNNFNLFHMAN